MIRVRPAAGAFLSRRALVAGAVAMAAVAPARATAAASLKVGGLAFGSVHWLTDTISRNGFDKAEGFSLDTVLLASSDAARIAFLGASVDAIAQDVLFAARLRAEGHPLRFLPYTSTEGALIAPANSPIRGVADLKGKSIGVSGGPLDKNWLLLRADAQTSAGLDLTKLARPVFGAPPLLAAKLASGDLDCALLYWSEGARLEAKGFRRVVDNEQVASRLGLPSKVALGGFLIEQGLAPETLIGFGKALRRAEDRLASDPTAWEAIRPLMRAPDEATFDLLKRDFLAGIPKKSRAAEIADAQAFFMALSKLGGSALVGEATSLPSDLYVDQAAFG